jgi:hypothetical protein
MAWWGDEGRGRAAVPIGLIEPGSTVGTSVDLLRAGLPMMPFDSSGSMIMSVTAELADGGGADSGSLSLGFHPVADGWRVYDVETRDSTYEGGALTAAARERRRAALARAAPDVLLGVMGTARIVGSTSSDAPPQLDGPPDPDQGGDR